MKKLTALVGAATAPEKLAMLLTRVRLMLVMAAAVAACRGGPQEPLGAADAFKLYVLKGTEVSPAGLPVVAKLADEDPRAVALQRLFGDGFGAEIIRTHFLAKQLIRDAHVGGRRFSDAARAAAAEPTVFVLGRIEPFGVGLALPRLLGGPAEHPHTPWIGLPIRPDEDKALVQTAAGRVARHIARLIAGGGEPPRTPSPPSALVEGYGVAMEVIAREWRQGEGKGPAGLLSRDAGTAEQRERFSAIRENRFIVGRLTAAAAPDAPAEGAARTAEPGGLAWLFSEPEPAATILYRMAQSRAVGHRVAPPEIYAAFVSQRIPRGVSPAAVLGPFRNFQAKLLGIWGRAVLRGAAPRHIAELVEQYGADLPAEKNEAIRIFVVTTYGATVKAGGVSTDANKAEKALPELTALAAEVAAGRSKLIGKVLDSAR